MPDTAAPEPSGEPAVSVAATAEPVRRLAPWVLPAGVFAAAFALRALTLVEERAGNPLYIEPPLDDRVYLRLADELRDAAAAPRPWFLAPLYPWLLAAASAGGPATMAIAGWFAVVVGSLTAAVSAWAARSLHSEAAGWIAGLLYAGAGVVVFAETLPGQEPVLCLVHAAALLLLVVYLSRGAPPWLAAALGALVGLAVLGRATTASLGVAFAAIVLMRVRPWRRAFAGLGLAAAGALVVLAPAAFRNCREFGDVTPLPWSGGSNLYMANGPFSRAFSSFASREIGLDPDSMERQAYEIAEEDEGQELSPAEVSSYWVRRTWDERGTASETLAHFGKKALMFWSAEEIANNHDVVLEREWSAWLRVAPVSSTWIFLLGVAGWWIARRRAPALDWSALVFVLAWATLTLYFPLSRYKLPLVPLAIVAVGAGAAEFVAVRGSRGRGIVAGAWVVAGACLSWFGTSSIAHFPGARNLALGFAARGDVESGIAILRRSLATEPDDGSVSETMGVLLAGESRFAEAIEQFGIARARGRWSAGVPEIYALTKDGRADEARRLAKDLAGKPMDTSLAAEHYANWALADLAAGDRAQASVHLFKAEELDRSASAVVRARAVIYK